MSSLAQQFKESETKILSPPGGLRIQYDKDDKDDQKDIKMDKPSLVDLMMHCCLWQGPLKIGTVTDMTTYAHLITIKDRKEFAKRYRQIYRVEHPKERGYRIHFYWGKRIHSIDKYDKIHTSFDVTGDTDAVITMRIARKKRGIKQYKTYIPTPLVRGFD
jgi:ssDNA-specific exonuclease RecJ